VTGRLSASARPRPREPRPREAAPGRGHRAPENYGRTYDRLRGVDMAYDATNPFHINQNIAPAS
jgi:hypothetical protein